MKITSDQLTRHAGSALKNIYLVHGDEMLLQQETADALRAAARAQGYSERELHHADRGADWNELLASANNLSLFGDKKILEIRFNAKPDASATAALERYAQNPSPDTLLLLLLPKLDGTAQKAKWFAACENSGVSVQLLQIDAHSFPDWLRGRLQQAGLTGSAETFSLLRERLEGNLLAAQQEIEKLKLVANAGTLTEDMVRNSVGDCARYNVYDLADCALQGHGAKAAKMLAGLRAEGVAETVVLWALSKDARTLAALREGLESGHSLNNLLQQNGIWQKRQPIFQRAITRIDSALAHTLVQEILAADKAIKGQSAENGWDVLLRLTLAMTGKPLFS